MTTITVLAGERSIGGTQIVVEDQGARLLFDCGMAFNPANDPFVHVGRRPGRALSDLLLAGLVPYIPGLYAPEALGELPAAVQTALSPSDGPLAVAISHSHLDHSHLAGFVDPAVPIYTSRPAARIVDLLGQAGHAVGGAPRSLVTPDGEMFSVGPMRVRLVPVDHDVCGARGMLIETSAGVVAYSGDLRLHGSHPEQTLDFARAARDAGARVLILEGTRLGQTPPDPALPPVPEDRVEDDVAPDVVRALGSIAGRLGVVLLTPENGERVEAIAASVANAGRTLVMEPEALALTIAALGRNPEPPYATFVRSGDHGTNGARQRGLEATTDTHQTRASTEVAKSPAAETVQAAVSSAPRLLAAEDIAADPGAYLLQLSFHRFVELLDLRPASIGGAVLACNGRPLGRFDPAWTALEWWAGALGLHIVEIGCTGHAAPHDLALIAGQSGASTVMSIHSRQPELLPVAPERLLLPERGHAYDLARLP